MTDILEAAERVVIEHGRLMRFEHEDGSAPLQEAIFDLEHSVLSALLGQTEPTVQQIPTGNLVIFLQKLAKNGSYYKPGFRSALLAEAARRLNDYRQKERQDDDH